MIEKIQLKNFRKFSSFELECSAPIVIFTGPNAAGKTSILESVYLAFTSKSHRTNEIESCIMNNEEFAKLKIQESKKEFQVVLSKTSKNYSINGKQYTKVSDYIGHVPILMFSPSDIELVSGSKGNKRHFLDLEISLLDKRYLRDVSNYKKILKERNEVLKNETKKDPLILDVLTNELIEELQKVYRSRIQFIDLLNQKLSLVSKELECENISISYLPTYDIDCIKECFERKKSYDQITKTTNIGAHRDDFVILMNGKDSKMYASEGQKRNIVLAMKLALKKIYEDKNQKVILLLDDVFASMDQKRINHIMKYIKTDSQTMITTTSLFNIPDHLLKDAKIVKL